jgi:hypothetical protein
VKISCIAVTTTTGRANSLAQSFLPLRRELAQLKHYNAMFGWFGALALMSSLFVFSTGALAQNVDLSTVPARDDVELTIYNSEDLTLVRERRRLSFSKGANHLQFSWANTLIDPTSVTLRLGTASATLTLLDTVFPHDKPQMLFWNVDSEADGNMDVEITYFTSGLTWNSDYTLVADADDKSARVEGFVRVHNRSGEAYEGARVRVVVGTINLVEKIAQLARIPMGEVQNLPGRRRGGLRLDAAKSMMMVDSAPRALASREGERKDIIKEGLSEYFIYTIEGAESIPNGWSKRLRSFEASSVPIRVRHRYRPAEYGDRLVRFYLARNDTDSGLGTTPLPGGEVRVFRAAENGGLTYQGKQSIEYVPIGDRIELNLGPDADVIFSRHVLGEWRDELWLRLSKSKTYTRVGDGMTVVDRHGEIAGWNENALLTRRIRNFSARPIVVEVRETISGDATFYSDLSAKRHDFQSVEFTVGVAPGQTRDALYEVRRKQGRNAKQTRLAIETKVVTQGVPGAPAG